MHARIVSTPCTQLHSLPLLLVKVKSHSADGSSESSSSSSSSSDVDSERKEAASGAVVAKDAKPAERSDPSPSSLPAWVESTVWLETAGHAAMAGLALVLLKVSAVEAAQRPGWLAPDVPNGVLWTLPLVASMFVLRAEPLRQWRALSEYEDFLREFVVPFVRKKSSFDMLLLAAGAGVSEELLFRGFGLNVLAERLPPLPGGVQADVAAVAVSGLVFGLLHAVTPVYALFATWAGLLLSTEYVVTGHLGAPMVTHALYDYVALLYLRTLPPLQRDAR
eukprot:jgi/Chlat1/2299/Chrsp17S02593